MPEISLFMPFQLSPKLTKHMHMVFEQHNIKKWNDGGDTLELDVERPTTLPEIELIIKGSDIDGKRKGADILSQV